MAAPACMHARSVALAGPVRRAPTWGHPASLHTPNAFVHCRGGGPAWTAPACNRRHPQAFKQRSAVLEAGAQQPRAAGESSASALHALDVVHGGGSIRGMVILQSEWTGLGTGQSLARMGSVMEHPLTRACAGMESPVPSPAGGTVRKQAVHHTDHDCNSLHCKTRPQAFSCWASKCTHDARCSIGRDSGPLPTRQRRPATCGRPRRRPASPRRRRTLHSRGVTIRNQVGRKWCRTASKPGERARVVGDCVLANMAVAAGAGQPPVLTQLLIRPAVLIHTQRRVPGRPGGRPAASDRAE